ncbi:MAG: tetratricopeptide repeat protein [Nitrospira sp.]|nr:tetratricopeptide repeat protein [Nitrospira sp.]
MAPEPNTVKRLRQKIKDGSANSDDYALLGGCVFLKGDFSESVNLYQRAIDVATTPVQKARVCIEFGWEYFEMGQEGEAQKLGQRAVGVIETERDCPEVWTCRGAAQALIAQVEWITDAEKGTKAAHLALANLERGLGASTEFKGKATGYFDAALLENSLGNADMAITLSEKYLQYELHEWEKISGLTIYAEALRNAGRLVEAHLKLQEALQYARDHKTVLPNLYLELGTTQCHMSRFNDAKHSFRQALLALEADPYGSKKANVFARTYLSLAGVCYELGDLKGAEAAYEEVVNLQDERSPYHCAALLGLGQSYRAANTEAKARECFEKVLASHTATEEERLTARVDLARSLYKSGEFVKAETAFQALLQSCYEDDARRANITLWLGHCYEGRGDYNKAMGNYEEVLAAHHAHPDDKTSAQEAVRRISPSGQKTTH